MDILSTETIKLITSGIKTIFIFAGVVLIGINYFHAKESKKMERKLDIVLPGSVNMMMSVQLLLSIAFLILSTVFLFIF